MKDIITPKHMPELTSALRRAFGEGLRKVEITIAADEAVTVRVERFTADHDLMQALYTLVNHGLWLENPL